MAAPDFIVVMGVSGCGKSAIAEGLAAALDGLFIEADRLHSAENVARMRQGIGLTDAMRWPWLATICDTASAAPQRPVVIACSALRRAYRDVLRERLDGVRFVFLDGPREVIAERMRARPGHFATVSLLDSQIATLEPPDADERALRLSVTLSPAEIVAAARDALSGARERRG
ncbi:gluconokinase [Ancylobacter oerskovii]|uniref:Gluconokinase n=1 Tax=Ancylobacter oerskovii TaxID=459519 RepID=A0ABW4Z1L8_9HYPH|nr:gluconokinase [Ancylobacter oerskovii]MBS7544941.1 gluconokinase [Ancylobacter oerskovii]